MNGISSQLLLSTYVLFCLLRLNRISQQMEMLLWTLLEQHNNDKSKLQCQMSQVASVCLMTNATYFAPKKFEIFSLFRQNSTDWHNDNERMENTLSNYKNSNDKDKQTISSATAT